MSSNNIAITVNNISKTFKIPHEKISTMRGAFVSVFKKKSYEKFKALDDVSFEIKKGEFFGIIGRNGSGKSTLLKVLAGIYSPDSGKIKINGRISPFLELGIGFNPELSGRDNIYLNATVLGLTKKQIDKKFDDIVAFSELERFIDQKIKNYSSGMQVRLAFSVAIHANRDILLMDEVLAVGDSNFQQKCLEEFNKYRGMGKTVILVTHDISTVQRYCDRALLLRNGKIETIGNPEEVGNKYIYQNMSDEEKRIFDEEKREIEKNKGKASKKTLDSRKKNSEKKIAEVEKVEFLNRDGESKNSFLTKETIIIRVAYQIFQSLSNPIFGIVIKDLSKKPVFITNNEFKKIKTGQTKKGNVQVDFEIDNLLASGSYSVSPAIATENKKILDWQDDLKTFRVINKDYSSSGVVDLEHKITIN